MTLNASIVTDGPGHRVITYREFTCPACGRCLLEVNGPVSLKIVCTRCKAFWKVDNGQATMISPPKRVAGKMLLDGVEKFFKK